MVPVRSFAQEPESGSGPAATSVSGYVSIPSLHRANRRHIKLFVNRRWVQDRALTHAIVQAYHTLLPVGRYPLAIVFLEMDPTDVDVNVHPAKREIKFRDGRKAFNAVQRAVRRAVVENAPVPTLVHTRQTWPTPGWERRETLLAADSDQPSSSQLALQLYRTADAGLELEPVGPVRLPLLRVVGQVGQTYVVAEGPQGLYLIDQHAAHERVLFEQMKGEQNQQAVTSQVLIEPLMVDLEPLLAGALADSLDLLHQVGFVLEPFGGTSYLLRAVPSILAVADPRSALIDILEMLQQNDDPLAAEAEQRVVAAVCKRAAIKAGQTLSLEEMQRLVRRLEQCESPRTCPHGRPTVLHFSVAQLERQFGRQ
jgi:DNA mismatch repair protein MutL